MADVVSVVVVDDVVVSLRAAGVVSWPCRTEEDRGGDSDSSLMGSISVFSPRDSWRTMQNLPYKEHITCSGEKTENNNKNQNKQTYRLKILKQS